MEALKDLELPQLMALKEAVEAEIKVKNQEIGVGATGKYPQGKQRPDDEGALVCALTTDDTNLYLNFGKPVAWLSMLKHQAVELGKQIIMRASA